MNERLPRNIQRQLEQAQAIEAQLAQPAAPVVEVVPEPQVEPVEPAPEPTPVVEVVATPPAPAGRGDAYWEQRLRTVQGMHDRVTRDLQAEVTAVRDAIKRLESKPAEPVRPAVDPKDVDAFGADMIDMVNKQAERVHAALSKDFAALAKTLDDRMAAIEANFTGVSQQAESTREDAFYAALTSAVPDWEQINASTKWLEWLAEVDSVYGAARQAALNTAHSARDAQRAIAIFKAFKDAQPKPRPTANLATQVAPATSGAAPAPVAAPVSRIIGQQEIHKFYNDVTHGRYRGREAEQQRLEAEINLALAEGRVR